MSCQEKESLTKPPNACIYCGSPDINEKSGYLTMRNFEVIVGVHCVACGRDWEEYFKIDRLIRDDGKEVK